MVATVAATTNYNGDTAEDTFSITGMTITPVVSLDGWTAGGTPNEPSVEGNTGNGAVTYFYSADNGSTWTETQPIAAGTYLVKASVAASGNYAAGESDPVSFTIAEAGTPVLALAKPTLSSTALANAQSGAVVRATIDSAAEVTGASSTARVAVGVDGATATFTSLPWNEAVDWTLSYTGAADLPGRFYAKGETEWFNVATDALDTVTDLVEGMKGVDMASAPSAAGQMVRIQTCIEIPDGAMDALPDSNGVGEARTGFAVAQLTGDEAPAFYAYTGDDAQGVNGWVKLSGVNPAANTTNDLLIVLDVEAATARYYVEGIALYKASASAGAPAYADYLVPMKAFEANEAKQINGIGFANADGVKAPVVAEYDVPFEAAVGDVPYVAAADGLANVDKTGDRTLYLLTNDVAGTIDLALDQSVKVDTAKGSFAEAVPVVLASGVPAGYAIQATGGGSLTNYSVVAVRYPIEYVLGLDGATNAVANALTNSYTVADLPITLFPAGRDGWTFDGWTNNFSANVAVDRLEGIAGAVTNWATWHQNAFTITWNVEGVTTTSEVLPGVVPSFTGTPEKTADNTYTYEFAGWSDTQGGSVIALPEASDNATYFAVFTPNYIDYTITWNYVDPATGNMTSDQTTVHWGQTPSHADPAGYVANNTIYAFDDWNVEPAAYDGTVIAYTATYTSASAAAMVISVADAETGATTTNYVATLADAFGANGAKNGDTVELLANVTLTERVEPNLGANTTLTIDLGGHTITREGTSGNGSVFDVKSGDVTITNGVIVCTQDDTAIAADGVYAITSRSGSNVTLADLTVTVNSECGACVYPFAGSTMTIESGTYANLTTTPYRWNTAITGMAVNQPNIADQLLIIKGGSFSPYDPQLGDDSGAMTDFTDDGFVAIDDGNGHWVVQPGYNVTFDANGGTPAPEAQRVAAGALVTAPATNPAKAGDDTVVYVFNAWQLNNADYDFAVAPTADITLVATYTSTSLAAATWVGGASGDWNVPVNWDIGYVPTKATVVTFTNNATVGIAPTVCKCKEIVLDNADVTIGRADPATGADLNFYKTEGSAVSGTGTLALDTVGMFNQNNAGVITIGTALDIRGDVTFKGVKDGNQHAGSWTITGKTTIADGVTVKSIDDAITTFQGDIDIGAGSQVTFFAAYGANEQYHGGEIVASKVTLAHNEGSPATKLVLETRNKGKITISDSQVITDDDDYTVEKTTADNKTTYTVVLGSATVIWVVDGTSTTETYTIGDTPVYPGETPTKAATDSAVYTFTGWEPAIGEVTAAGATYTAQFSALTLAPVAQDLHYNCTSQVAVVGAPAGATFYWTEEVIPGQSSGGSGGISFGGDTKPLSVSSGRKTDTLKFYSNTTNGTWHLTASVTNENAEIAQLVATVTVKDVAAVVDGVEYTKAQLAQAVADAIANDKVLGLYVKGPDVQLAAGQTIKVKALCDRNKDANGKLTVTGPAGTDGTVYVVGSTVADGVRTYALTAETPSVMFTSADGVTTNYLDAAFKATQAGTYKLLKDIARSQLSVGTTGVVLDLNGKTFTSTATGTTAAINVTSTTGTAGLTVIDSSEAGTGAIVAPNYSAIQSGKNASVAIEGGAISGKTVLVYTLSGGTVAISGGTFSMVSGAADSMLNCKDDNRGTITVTGGSFNGFDPATSNAADGDMVAEGYVSVADRPEAGWYTVVPAYTVLWVVEGTTVETDEGVGEGEAPSYDGAEPAKPADAQFTYGFAGWTTNGTDVLTLADVQIVSNTTFTAKFTETTNQYTVIWIVDGTPTTNKVDYGTATSTIRPSDPTKENTSSAVYAFTGWLPEVAATVTQDATYTAGFSSIYIDPASLELYPNCSNYVHVVGAPEGSTYTYKFAGQVKSDSYLSNPPGWSKTEGWAWPYGKQPGGTGTITVTVTNDNAQIAVLTANVTVKDVAAVVNGVEYASADFANALAAAKSGDKVLEMYYYMSSYGKVALAEGESIRWKPADNRGKGSFSTIAVTVPATTDAAWYKAVASKDNETGITTITCVNQGVPYVKIDDGTTVTYSTESFTSMSKAGATYTLLRDMTDQTGGAVSKSGVVLDLNGKKLGLATGIKVAVNSAASLTIRDTSQAGTGEISGGNDSSPLVWVTGGGTATIESGTFVSDGTTAVYTENGTASITGGTFSTTAADKTFLLNCKDSNKETITVTGGSFQGFNPQNNTADGEGTDYVAEGYYAFPNDPSSGWYTVHPAYTVQWVVEGETVEIDENVVAGSAPSYDGAEPAKAADAQFTYDFIGWATNGTDVLTLANVAIVSDTTFVAQFAPTGSKATVIRVVDGTPTEIGYYTDLASAIAEAQDGDTVKLLADIELPAMVTIPKDKGLTLDLAGHEIAPAASWARATSGDALVCVAFGGSLTVEDGSDPSTGAIRAGDSGNVWAAVKMTNAGDDSANGTATLVVNGGTLSGYYYGIVGNGSRHGTSITVNGGVVEGTCPGDNLGIFHPQSGTLTLNGGAISGASGVEMRAGTLVVPAGSTVEVTADGAFSATANGSGTTVVGAAIALSQHNTDLAVSANIAGGTFTATGADGKAFYEADLQNDNATGIAASLTGGTFLGAVETENVETLIPEGSTALFSDANAEGVAAGYALKEVAGSDPTMYAISPAVATVFTVADNGTTTNTVGYYATLAEAVGAATNGCTVALLADVNEAIVNTADKTFTIDLNGKTWSSDSDVLATTAGTITIEATNGGTMTTEAAQCCAVWGKGGDVVINGGTFNSKDNEEATIYVSNADSVITINGGTFENKDDRPYRWKTSLHALTLNVKNDLEGQLLVINGGTFIGNDPQLGDDSGQTTDFTADGYVAILENGNWVVQPGYNVTFDANGGDPTPAAQRVKAGDPAAEPTGVALANHSLRAWQTNGVDWVFTDAVPSDMTLVADWAIDQCTVIWIVDGTPTTNKVDYGTATSTIQPANPTKETTSSAIYTFTGWSPEVAETVTQDATYVAQFSAFTIDPVVQELYYNCTGQVAVVGYPEGATFCWTEEVIPGESTGSGSGYSFSGDVKPLTVSGGRKTDKVKFYSNTTNGTWHLTASITNNSAEVAQLVATVTVKDVVAVVDGVEYPRAQWADAIAAAKANDKVLGVYASVPATTLAVGETLQVKKLADKAGLITLPTVTGPAATAETVYVVNKVADSATGITTYSLTAEEPSVMFVSADGVTTNYLDAAFKATQAGTYTLLKDISRSQLSVGTTGVVLDLNGKTFTSTATGTTAAINVTSTTGSASLTVVDSSEAGTGAIVAPNYSAVQAAKNGSVSIEGGAISGKTVVVYTANGGTAAISGGTFSMVSGSADSMLNCKDDNRGTISVTGGSFEGFDPATSNAADGNMVAEGCWSFADDPSAGWYTVAEKKSVIGTTITVAEVEYDGTAKEPVPTVVFGGTTLTATDDYTVAYASNTNAGNATVTITGVNAWKDFTNVTFAIAQRPATFAAASDTKVYDGQPLSTNGFTTANLVEGHVATATVAGSRTDVGASSNVVSAAVIKDADGNDVTANYDVTYKDGELKVTAATITITIAGSTSVTNTFDGTLQTVAATWTATSESPLFDETKINWRSVSGTGTNVGTHNYGLDEEQFLYDDENVTATFTVTDGFFAITPASVTVKADDDSKKHGESDPAEFTATVTGLFGTDTVSYTVSRAPGNDVGTYTITPTGDALQGNYTVTYETGTFTIEENKITIIWVVDGNETTNKVEWGDMPAFAGSTDKASDAKYDYMFTGWTPEVTNATVQAIYTAGYAKTIGTPLALALDDPELSSTVVTPAAKTATVAADLIGAVEGVTVTEASGAMVTIDEDTATASFLNLEWNQGVEWTMTAQQTAADDAQTAEYASLPGKFYVKPEAEWFSATTNQLAAVADASDATVAYTAPEASNEGEMVRVHTTVAVPAVGLSAAPAHGSAKVGFAVLQLDGDSESAYYAFGNGTWTKLSGAKPTEGDHDYLAVYDLAAAAPTVRYYIDGVALYAAVDGGSDVYALPLAAGTTSLKSISFASKEMVKDDIVAEQDVSYVAAVGQTAYTNIVDAVAAQGKNEANTLALLKQNVGLAESVPLTATTEKFVVDYTRGSFTNENPAVSGLTGYEVTNVVAGNVTTYELVASKFPLTITYTTPEGIDAPATFESNVVYNTAYSVPSPAVVGHSPDVAVVSGTMPAEAVTTNVTYTVDKHLLTITYTTPTGVDAPATFTSNVVWNTAYSVASPAVEGYTPDPATVSGTMGTADVTTNVTYTATEYTITYAGLDGATVDGTNPATYTIETADITLVNPTKDGFTFAGWTGTGLGDATNLVVTVAKGSTGDRTYTATWAENKVTVIHVVDNGDGTATTNVTGYVTLADAIAAAEDGDTVQLLADVEEPAVALEDDITLDLNGNEWTVVAGEGESEPGTIVVSGDVAIVDNSENGGGAISSAADEVLVVDAADEEGATASVMIGGDAAIIATGVDATALAVVDGEATVEGDVTGGVAVAADGALTVDGGTVTGDVAATGGDVTVADGTVDGGVTAEGDSTVAVSGGSVTDGVAVSDGADVTVSDGSVAGGITAEDDGSSVTVSDDGAVTGGVAVSDGADVTISGGTVAGGVSAEDAGSEATITGGEIAGGVTVADGATGAISGDDTVVNGALDGTTGTLSITDGLFENDPTDYLAEGYVAIETAQGYDVQPGKSVIGTTITVAGGTYNGQAYEIGSVVLGNYTLTADDYTVVYTNVIDGVATNDNVNAGSVTAWITGKGEWIDTTNVTFTIDPAVVTVTAPSKDVRRGTDPATLTFEDPTYSGFVNNENESVLTTRATAAAAANDDNEEYSAASRTGATFPIVASGAAAANYTFTYVEGTLTVVAGAIASVDGTEYDTIAGAVADAGTTADGMVITMLDDADADVVLAFGDVLKVALDGFGLTVKVSDADALRYRVAASDPVDGVTTYTVEEVKANGLMITEFDFDDAYLVYNTGKAEDLAWDSDKAYCTVVTATDLKATRWNVVGGTCTLHSDLGANQDVKVQNLDTTGDVRFFRIAVTPYVLSVDDTVEFAPPAEGNEP